MFCNVPQSLQKKQKAAGGAPHSAGGLQVFWSAVRFVLTCGRLTAAIKLDLPGRDLRQNRHAVLDAQSFNFTVPKITAKPYKLTPSRRKHVFVSGRGGRHCDNLSIIFTHESLLQ